MSSIKKQNEDLFTYVKSIILTYCPYSNDRLSILGNIKSPEIDIEVNIRDNQTQVMFLFGNNSFKQSIPEQIIIPYIIEFDEISEIIENCYTMNENTKECLQCNRNYFNNKIENKFNLKNLKIKSTEEINIEIIKEIFKKIKIIKKVDKQFEKKILKN